jgi:hypothetical protein
VSVVRSVAELSERRSSASCWSSSQEHDTAAFNMRAEVAKAEGLFLRGGDANLLGDAPVCIELHSILSLTWIWPQGWPSVSIFSVWARQLNLRHPRRVTRARKTLSFVRRFLTISSSRAHDASSKVSISLLASHRHSTIMLGCQANLPWCLKKNRGAEFITTIADRHREQVSNSEWECAGRVIG